MDRREFLKRSALLSAALATSDIAQASDILQPYSGHPEGKNQDAAEEALPHEEAGKSKKPENYGYRPIPLVGRSA